MRLICYPTSADPPKIVAAPVERDWMDRTGNGFAYRCLPLNIANAHGWLLLNTVPFVAQWDGGSGLDAVTVTAHWADNKTQHQEAMVEADMSQVTSVEVGNQRR